MFFKFKVNTKGSSDTALYNYFQLMDNIIKTDEVDIDYTLIYKDKNNILSDINFENEDDRLICEAIVDNLEKMAADEIKAGKNISLPFIGTIERNWYKEAIRNDYQEFREYKANHTEEEYKAYFKAKCEEYKANHAELEDKYKRNKRFKTSMLPKYINHCKNRGVAYANAWLKMIGSMKVVEFDPEIEEVYERFRTGLDADD